MLKKSAPFDSKLSHAQRSNLEYIEDLYQRYLKNEGDVEPEWRLFFEGVEFAKGFEPKKSAGAVESVDPKILAHYRVIEAYRNYGHLDADLNPLLAPQGVAKELELSSFGLTESDLSQPIAPNLLPHSGAKTLGEALQFLKRVYCGKRTVQVGECEPQVRDWFFREMETDAPALSAAEKKEILLQLIHTEALEKFLHSRFVGAKRFSVEGTDALIPMLERVALVGRQNGMEELVIGMAHRGRLNVLATFMGKSLEDLFAQFEGIAVNKNPDIDGDVKYHLGYSSERETPNGKCKLTLAFNPSHLEAVNPVATGMARAKQRMVKDTLERKKTIPLLVHGDAAFAGQGVVLETLQMSQLRGYRVGGTVHIVANNQVGFTTDPKDARSSRYPTDIAKGILAPVIHVNGDDVEACIRAVEIALKFRQSFSRDVVIQFVGYRRFGHNEGDEPTFTQPVLYQHILKHPTLREIYAQKLIDEGVVDQVTADSLYQDRINELQEILVKARANPPDIKYFSFTGAWQGLKHGKHDDVRKAVDTTVPLETLKRVGQKLVSYPKDLNIHAKVKALVEKRAKMVEGSEPIDWGMGELLAYGALLSEGTPVRLSGQDCIRGTFSHRHSMFFDMKTGEGFNPLNTINPPKEFCVYNSLLSEFGVLGFEYGNSITDPSFLTIWEAQFGDFANGAQIIIDQYISAGEAKWQQMSGLVLLLPHGYEGQGPEHSSARLERFLQLCAQDNLQVCNFTTPAQLFHALRRQIKRDFRKPLIVMSPKSLLRHPKVVSSLDDLSKGTFHEVLDDSKVTDRKKIESAVLCSGKLYYDLEDERERRGAKAEKVALIRVEQLYPLADDQIAAIFRAYPNLKRVTWSQEEPQNMGAHTFIMPKLQSILKEQGGRAIELRYVGRNMRASPATGSPQLHKAEQTAIVTACFD